MGKIAKKGNKSLFEVVDRIKELLRVDPLHDIYSRINETVLSEILSKFLEKYTEIIKAAPERDGIQNMFMFCTGRMLWHWLFDTTTTQKAPRIAFHYAGMRCPRCFAAAV